MRCVYGRNDAHMCTDVCVWGEAKIVYYNFITITLQKDCMANLGNTCCLPQLLRKPYCMVSQHPGSQFPSSTVTIHNESIDHGQQVPITLGLNSTAKLRLNSSKLRVNSL